MSHVDRRPAPVAEFGPTWHPHLPPVIRGRDVVDVALPGDGAEPGGVENGPGCPPPGLGALPGPARPPGPRAAARRLTSGRDNEQGNAGQTQHPNKEQHMTDQLTAVLLVDVTSSRCGHCGKPVLVEATNHVDVSGWDRQPGGGCGARFTATRSTHSAVRAEHLLRVRPDLPVDATQPAP